MADFGADDEITRRFHDETEQEHTARLVDLRDQYEYKEALQAKGTDNAGRQTVTPEDVEEEQAAALSQTTNSEDILVTEKEEATLEQNEEGSIENDGYRTSQSLFDELEKSPADFFSRHAGLVEAFGTLASGCKINMQVYGRSEAQSKSECISFNRLIEDKKNVSAVAFMSTLADLANQGRFDASTLTYRMRNTLRRAERAFQDLEAMKYY